MLPRVGSSSPVSSRKRVVFPVPFRPTMPQRSPGATVNETSENRVVAPKSTPTPPKPIWVMPRASLGARADEMPDGGGARHGHRTPERHAQRTADKRGAP